MTPSLAHVPVMLAETLALLAPHAGGVYVDATLGRAGHAEAILEASGPDGRLIGLDRDPEAIEAARARLQRFGDRASLVHGDFAQVATTLASLGIDAVDGLLADVGVSSPQLDDPARGFSFRHEGPLDMRMDPTRGETARELIDRLDAEALANVLYELGEERRSRAVARRIKEAAQAGELETTADLRRAVHRAMGPRRGRIDPATRTFQALRIAVNGELDQLRALLSVLPDVLADGGVAVILTFHSLEDRLVKRAFREDARLTPLTKKPLTPSEDEIRDNPRSRPTKLRGARRVPREVAA